MVASKLAVILDDILWVLTRSQFLKLSSFVHYLINLRAQYLPLSHKQGTGVKSAPTQTTPPMHGTGQGSNLNQMFSAYDLVETSIHLRLHRIDLHFCDDSMLQGGQSKEDNSDPFNQVGSALQWIHSKNLCHLDVKLDNILVFKSDFSLVKLCDFVSVKHLGDIVIKKNGRQAC